MHKRKKNTPKQSKNSRIGSTAVFGVLLIVSARSNLVKIAPIAI